MRDDLSDKDLQRVLNVTRPTSRFDAAEPFEAKSGGAATSDASVDGNAFSHPSANLSFEEREPFFVGNGIFKKLWVSSPSSTAASDGLGPLYNARACQRCHLKDGRGHPPRGPDDVATTMLMRLSVPPQNAEDEARLASFETLRIPEPSYGGQLQDHRRAGPRRGRPVLDHLGRDRGAAVRRRNRIAAHPQCHHQGPRLRADGARRDDLAQDRQPDDRARPSGGDPPVRHPCARGPRRCGWRRHLRQAVAGARTGDRAAHARPLRLEGDDARAWRSSRPKRSRATSASRRRS